MKSLLEILKKQKVQKLDSFFTKLFSREELIEILEYLYLDEIDKFNIEQLNDNEPLDLIGNDTSILEFYIQKLEENITSTNSVSPQDVSEFFERTNNETHYLYSKPLDQWDEYDRSNYNSLLFKSGKTKRVFAIFTSDVDEKDKYLVTTKPSFFFDTKKEAETELNNLLTEENFEVGDLKIMTLWKIH